MSIIKNTAEKIARKLLAKELKKQTKHVEFHNMKSAKYIGILFDTNEKDNNSIVSNFYTDLKKQGFKISVAGWYEGIEVPKKPINTLDFIYFSEADSNWRGIPQTHDISEFFEQQFDVLFILTQSKNLPVQYIISLSPASFKVGSKGNNSEYLDFMIEQKENTSIKKLIQDSITYLSEIKKN